MADVTSDASGITIDFNTDITIGSTTIDARCFLQLIVLKIEYKPIILAIISILEGYIAIVLASTSLLNTGLEALLSYTELLLNLAQSAVDLVLNEYNQVKTLGTSVPCVALDKYFQPVDFWVNNKVKAPFNDKKEKYLKIRQSLNRNLALENLLRFNQQFFSSLKELINKLPEASISFTSTSPSTPPGQGVVKSQFPRTSADEDPYKINWYPTKGQVAKSQQNLKANTQPGLEGES